MSDKNIDRTDSDPSFIRKDASELINWARRLGMSQQEMREALDGGLIRPTAAGTPRTDEARDERPASA
jgi:hypothetical protein